MSDRTPLSRSARASTTLFALACLALSGCAGATGAPEPDVFSSTDRPPRIRLLVRNMNFADVRLYALRRTGRQVIGTVQGKQDREFELDWDVPERLSLEIDMLAGPNCVTEELQVDPGDLLQLEVAVNFEDTPGCR